MIFSNLAQIQIIHTLNANVSYTNITHARVTISTFYYQYLPLITDKWIISQHTFETLGSDSFCKLSLQHLTEGGNGSTDRWKGDRHGPQPSIIPHSISQFGYCSCSKAWFGAKRIKRACSHLLLYLKHEQSLLKSQSNNCWDFSQ